MMVDGGWGLINVENFVQVRKTFNVPLMKVYTKVNKFLIKMSIGQLINDEYSLIRTELSVQISLPNLKLVLGFPVGVVVPAVWHVALVVPVVTRYVMLCL